MNRKGFMMAEVVVVSSIVLITLVSFYVSYNKIISEYNKRIDYYDVTTLYDLAYVRKNISDISKYDSMELLVDGDDKKVYYLNTAHLKSLEVANQTFKDYLNYLDGSVTFKSKDILVMERCSNNDINNCKYAYLEAYNFNDKTPPLITFDITEKDDDYYAVITCSDEESGIIGDEVTETLLVGDKNITIEHICTNVSHLQTSGSHTYKYACLSSETSCGSCAVCTSYGQKCEWVRYPINDVGDFRELYECFTDTSNCLSYNYVSCHCENVCNKYGFKK